MSTAYGLVWVVIVTTSHDYTSDTIQYLNAFSTHENAVAFLKHLGAVCDDHPVYPAWEMPNNFDVKVRIEKLYIDESVN